MIVDNGRYAVAIVGAGTAGCAAALALAARGIEGVLVIDKDLCPRWRMGETIPPATNLVLQRLGVWRQFLAQEHLPSSGSCASWGKTQLGYNDAILDGQGKGWHLHRTAFDTMLAACAAARGAKVARGCRLRNVERSGRYHVLAIDDGEGTIRHVVTDLLVDATGIAAGAVRSLGVARNQIDRLAVIGKVVDLKDPAAVPSQALVEACEYGWWYAAKLPRARMIVTVAVEAAQHHRFVQPDRWHQALGTTRHVATWLRNGGAEFAKKARLETALAPSAILSCVAGEGWLAIGDAASAFDPISAQGIFKALSDGETAAEAIASYQCREEVSSLGAYQDGVFSRFRNYLRVRQQLYAREQRWPNAPFWNHRLSCL